MGIVIASLAGTIETLFSGWELVGLSSALLVAFYHERPRGAKWTAGVDGVSDFGRGLVHRGHRALYHLTGEGDFDKLLGAGPWPGGEASLTGQQAFAVGLLLLIAAAGKSALVPFSGWLPRAPWKVPRRRCAVFYGALSVHLELFCCCAGRSGSFLGLERCGGWRGAGYAAVRRVRRPRADGHQMALSFASLTQVGLIVAEIGLGFRYIALVHMIGDACLRTLQFYVR